MNKQAFSKIWIVIIVVIILIGGGIFGYQYLGAPKEKEIEKPEEVVPKETAEELVNWEIYRNEKFRFEIKYPFGWTKEEQAMGSGIVFLSPLESALDMFRENLNVIVQDLSAQPMTLSEYTDLSVNQISQFITDVNIVDSSATTLAGNSAHKVVYTGKQGQYNLNWMQIWTINNNKSYIITYTAEIDKYSDFLETIQEMINSFKLI